MVDRRAAVTYLYLSEIKRRIVCQLRDGALDQSQIAAGIGEAPFRVRAELLDLKRVRFVHDTFRRDGHIWQLTNVGLEYAWRQAQETN
jgi:hypothetical protein